MNLLAKAIIFFVLPLVNSFGKIDGPKWNPKCPATFNCDTYFLNHSSSYPESINNLVYYVNDEPDSRFHFLISTINGLSILLIESTPQANLSIDWPAFLQQNMSLCPIKISDGEIKHSFAIGFSKFYRYIDDDKDEANIDSASQTEAIPFQNVLWKEAIIDQGILSVQLTTSNDSLNPQYFGTDGKLTLSFQLFDSDGISNLTPHLLHNDRSAQFEISLINLHNNFNSSRKVRYALEMFIVAHKKSETNLLNIKSMSTINDEYTPGIFETNVLSNSFDDTYLMWKPVCYYDELRGRSSLSRVSHNSLKDIQADLFIFTGLIGAFYGVNVTNLDVKLVNMSFGMPRDKFYNGFQVWTLQIGFGPSPKESFSTLIITMIILCVATPCGAFVGGGLYGAFRKLKRQEEDENDH